MTGRIAIERAGLRIELRGWIGQDTPGLCKSVPSAKWNPEGKFWTYPLDMSTCRALRATFGDELSIGPELAAWSRVAVVEERRLATIANADSAELVNVPRYAPRIAAAMANRTYQQAAAAYGARAGSFWIFDQPGLGKTVEALGALVEATADEPDTTLVFCPKVAVQSVWGNEIAQWLPDAAVFVLSGTRRQREAVLTRAAEEIARGQRKVFVIGNIEMARIKPWFAEGSTKPVFKVEPGSYVKVSRDGTSKTIECGAEWPELFGMHWDNVIVDESHRALIRKPGASTQVRAGMDRLGKAAKKRIPLSGTPMRGKPENLWGTLNWTRPELFTSYWNWVKRYFALTSNGFSDFVLDGFLPDGEKRLGKDLKLYGLRRTKGEVLKELPPKQYAGSYLIPGDDNSPHGVWLTMEGPQRKMYDTFEREAAVTVEGGEIMADGILAENTRRKQLAGATLKTVNGKVRPILPSVKFDWLVEKLDELGIVEGDGEAKIVVASQFTSLLNVFASELTSMGIRLHLLTGETPDKARQAMVKDFQETTGSDAVRVFLLNTQAGGVAVTLDSADDLVLLDETYSPDDQEQVEDRIHRTSRMHSVTIHVLRCLDTIEEQIAWITAAREDVMKYLLDGARGVDAAKQIYLAKSAA